MSDEAKVAIVFFLGFFILIIAMVLSENPKKACISKGNIYINENNVTMCIPLEQYKQFLKAKNGTSNSNSQ